LSVQTVVARKSSEAMPLLHLAFQEGFDGDTVVVRVDGKEIFRNDNVKTRLQIGYADSFEGNFNEGPVTIDILLPIKNISETVPLQLTATKYLGISIQQGRINCRISDQPFGYV
jgi:hypothetical protein